MEHRLLLQDRWTDSDDELVAECNFIRDALKKHYNVRAIGYDPGVLVCDVDNPHRVADIPTWLLRRMLSMVAPMPDPKALEVSLEVGD